MVKKSQKKSHNDEIMEAVEKLERKLTVSGCPCSAFVPIPELNRDSSVDPEYVTGLEFKPAGNLKDSGRLWISARSTGGGGHASTLDPEETVEFVAALRQIPRLIAELHDVRRVYHEAPAYLASICEGL